ncbi:MAG: hypothetical protein DRI83_12565 [Bacteroidetes bacterium]|nr:MAG: hypothetical protein DRI83_12565 [Bacteroidota bacterium]
MKKSFLFALVLCISMAISAQNIPPVINHQKGKLLKIENYVATKEINPFMNYGVNMASNKGMIAPTEEEIGETFYDLQTNASLNNRFQVWDDGTMAAVWTRGMEATSFPNRGTAYNYFDGTNWEPWPTVRLEDRRCGWPSIAAWGAEGEITVAHNGSEGLEWMQRETKGSGAWTQTNFLGPAGIENDLTWPRMITTGDNNEYIHLFVHSYVEYMGQPGALLYSRSDDGGDTWDPHNIILDGMGQDDVFEIQADGYTMSAKGNTVCVLVGSPWMDLFYMRSDDNGDTWDKQIVWEHPYPLLDPVNMYTDTFFCMDRTAQMTLDDDGHAHVVFALQRAISEESGYGLYAWNPDYDGIAYWNDEMEPFSGDINALAPPQLGFPDSEMIQDVNYIGWMQDVDGDGLVTLEGIQEYHSSGMSQMPSIYVDEFGNRFVIYASNTETFVYTGYTEPVNYKHIWARRYSGGAWGEFVDLNDNISHVFDECIYPLIGKASGQSMHYIYNVDIGPGSGFLGTHEYQQNRIIYGYYDFPVGIGENISGVQGISVELSPNPATDKVMVKFNLEDPADVSVSIMNITGQRVREVKQGQMNGCININIEVGDLPAGTYVCTVKAGNALATEKLIVR